MIFSFPQTYWPSLKEGPVVGRIRLHLPPTDSTSYLSERQTNDGKGRPIPPRNSSRCFIVPGWIRSSIVYFLSRTRPLGKNLVSLFSFFCGLNRSSEEEFLSLRKDFRRNRNPLADEPFFPRILLRIFRNSLPRKKKNFSRRGSGALVFSDFWLYFFHQNWTRR